MSQPKVSFAARFSGRPVIKALSSAFVAGLLLSGCSSPSTAPASTPAANSDETGDSAWKQIVDGANKEGKVVVYLSITGVDDRLKAAWKAAYPGISLEIFRTGSAELLSRLDQEKGTGATGADVAVMADASWYEKNSSRLLGPTGPQFPKLWQGTNFSRSDGKYVLVDAAPLGVAYNTDVVSKLGAQPIESYKDLLQPKLKDYVGFTPAGNAAAALQWWYEVSKSIGGTEALQQLKALDPHPYPSLVPMVQALAAGEHAVVAYSSLASAKDLQAQGAPIKVVVPKPAVGGGHYVSVVDWSKNMNAAQVFRNWLLSPAGQIALNGPGDLYTPLQVSAIPNAPTTMTSIPADMVVTDGVITPEQKTWMDKVWTPAFG